MALKPSQLWLDDLLDVLVDEFVARAAVSEQNRIREGDAAREPCRDTAEQLSAELPL